MGKHSKRNMILWIIAVVVVGILIGVITFLVISNVKLTSEISKISAEVTTENNRGATSEIVEDITLDAQKETLVEESEVDKAKAAQSVMTQTETMIQVERSDTTQETENTQTGTALSESITAAPPQTTTVKGVVAIDPGHTGPQIDMSAQEPIGPGASDTKARATTGTNGRFTGVPEYQLNLDIGLQVRDELISRGYQVVMAREDNNTDISNAERAQQANESADISVRLHANGSEDSSQHGALAYIMAADNQWTGNLYEQSRVLSDDIMKHYCQETGFPNVTTLEENDMTGINWSTIPVMILEMGYMSNESDDTSMQNPEFQKKMVKGIVDGIEEYFTAYPSTHTTTTNSYAVANTEATANTPTTSSDTAETYSSDVAVLLQTESAKPQQAKQTTVTEMQQATAESTAKNTAEQALNTAWNQYIVKDAAASRETWSVSLKNLTDGSSANYNGSIQLSSASLMKLFIMAAYYDRVVYPQADPIVFDASYGDADTLLYNMITVSDNDSANLIVKGLGLGDIAAGMAVVNQYCQENGYTATTMGRLFLDNTQATDTNLTTTEDCCKLLTAIYGGTCVNQEASANMLDYLKQQQKTTKIPAGITDADVVTANKTGELFGEFNSYVQNDAAIIWGTDADYVLCIMSKSDQDNTETSLNRIVSISSAIYQALK